MSRLASERRDESLSVTLCIPLIATSDGLGDARILRGGLKRTSAWNPVIVPGVPIHARLRPAGMTHQSCVFAYSTYGIMFAPD